MSQTLYQRLGGESAVQELVNRFYLNMFELDNMQRMQELHQNNLDEVKEKLFMYFSGWFGGPSLFVDRHGHPKLRARHQHIDVGTLERDQWLRCMHTALNSMQLDTPLHQELLDKIDPMADHMRNQLNDGDPNSNCNK